MSGQPGTGSQPVAGQFSLDAAGRPLDQIRLVGIAATGYHGVFAHERREGQTFVADVVVHLDTRRAAALDDLGHTIDYGELAERVAAVLAGEPADLIETVAERVAATALAYGQAVAVDVAVHKPQAPIAVPFDDVVVAIHRDRTKLPAAEPWRPPAESAIRSGVEAPAVEETAVGPVGDVLDVVPAQPVDVVLALGSNLGAAQATLRDAVSALARVRGLTVVDVSPLARTAAVGGPDQPDYLNAVVLARTTLSARDLLHATQEIEQAHGRERLERWGPRTLDVDLIVYGSTLAVTADLELPHPRAYQRAFVLEPWAQVAPDAVLPGLGGGPVAALAATAPDRAGIRWMALDWLTSPVPAAAPEPVAAAPAAPEPAGAAPRASESGPVAVAPGPGAAPERRSVPAPSPDATPRALPWPPLHDPDDGAPGSRPT
jgi:dihydroneopterin aldolase/2-amino-4-hydroxy-6-hydroxymethyldihydropteridine diphosphokinase